VLSNILDIIQIGKEIGSSVTLAPGKTLEKGQVLFASESMIFIDILANVSSEGPIVTLICFLAVGGLIWSGFRKLKEFLIVYTFLSLGMFAFIATLQFFEVKLNFFNFITIPITIGIGVDYALYLLSIQLAQQRAGASLAVAYKRSIQFVGKVVALVGITLAAGVVTWAWSPIKFQADMGILLTFMFLWNMIGALVLIPVRCGAGGRAGPHAALLALEKTPGVIEFEWHAVIDHCRNLALLQLPVLVAATFAHPVARVAHAGRRFNVAPVHEVLAGTAGP